MREAQIALKQLQGSMSRRSQPPSPRGFEVLQEFHLSTQLFHGIPPTVAELAKSVGASRPTVHAHLLKLAEKGYLKRTGHDTARPFEADAVP